MKYLNENKRDLIEKAKRMKLIVTILTKYFGGSKSGLKRKLLEPLVICGLLCERLVLLLFSFDHT